MKKLSLKKLNLAKDDLLQRNDLKAVLGGGYGNGGHGGGGGCWGPGHYCVVNGSIPCCEGWSGYAYCKAEPGYVTTGRCVQVV